MKRRMVSLLIIGTNSKCQLRPVVDLSDHFLLTEDDVSKFSDTYRSFYQIYDILLHSGYDCRPMIRHE